MAVAAAAAAVAAALLLLLAADGTVAERLPPTCPSDIYCTGPLLHVVQMASIYHDSKTFVDMKMKYSSNETLRIFEDLMKRTEQKPSRLEVELFVNETFEPAGSEFESWTPDDWIQQPRFLENIADPDLRQWGSKLNLLWNSLGRKMKEDVRINHDRYSIIYVPHPVIVPGGRFREFYYWDSYWIIKGLILSEMFQTVKGMLTNFLSIVDMYGFIPNGGRIYYAMRSQPPLLIPMMKSYVDATHDVDFIKSNIHILEKEFQFWLTNHTVEVEKDGKVYTLARYKDASQGPRPESYREDILSATFFKTDEEKESYYRELKTAAESGWDFSTRWFILNGTNRGNLTNLKTSHIIPVDLNAIMYWNAQIMYEFYRELGNGEKAVKFQTLASNWLEAVTQVLWHEEVGVWLDYDMLNNIKRDYFYPTNIAPLWTMCYHRENTSHYVAKVMKYLEKSQVMVHQGGIPTTLEHSGEQWDYPNAWPPLQYIMIMGLEQTGDSWAQDLAFEITEKWVRSNFKAFNETGAMFEKYDAIVPGGHGGGGEYEVQAGFGWTNGVIMELLDRYGKQLTTEERLASLMSASSLEASDSSSGVVAGMLTVLLALAATIAAGCIGESMNTYTVSARYYHHYQCDVMLLVVHYYCLRSRVLSFNSRTYHSEDDCLQETAPVFSWR
ncbi:trehalase isoform X2 [Homalodisca vitripennis]|uniref:trehalase isoform X2 n=1 Tax=Homalodisca vitripennis TaxID=197043 RepID=UPI001EEA1A19|nr:trehalase isoform X2 [Homalodisca vitripennis]